MTATTHNLVPETLGTMTLSSIAGLIEADWSTKGTGVNYAAEPYLKAMSSLVSVEDDYFLDPGAQIVSYFLANATSWRGETAKAVKAELRKRLKAHYG